MSSELVDDWEALVPNEVISNYSIYKKSLSLIFSDQIIRSLLVIRILKDEVLKNPDIKLIIAGSNQHSLDSLSNLLTKNKVNNTAIFKVISNPVRRDFIRREVERKKTMEVFLRRAQFADRKILGKAILLKRNLQSVSQR